ncbi:uncharacterized protein F4817DRAFT_364231 [Daldinia loculata]|uniref:uncharacterized protein n=1 Tax=Daldinia loculata TaxID=103429 RepID=UPI0020C3DB2E|nr:uncharacterized protein F4817DRAFT_364231 [Daldinia loculata]KAI1648570.1 hypothetical protein F4817DRAFT_364231 [Daldinia loculata]
MLSVFKSVFKFVGKAAVYGIVAIGVWEALLGCPSAKMMNKLLRDKDAWDPRQAEQDGVCQHVQIWFMSWWHCAIRSPAKYIAKRVKVVATKAKRSYIRGWMARNQNNNTNASTPRGEERVSRFHEELDGAIHDLTTEANRACINQSQEDDDDGDWYW